MKQHTNRSIPAKGWMAISLIFLFIACNNDSFIDTNVLSSAGQKISFGIVSATDAQTRVEMNDDNAPAHSRFVLRSVDTRDTLCVSAVITDAIYKKGLHRDDAVTRAQPVSTIDEYGNFNVLAYCMLGNKLIESFYMNENVSNCIRGVWQTQGDCFWPTSDYRLRFFAYAPTDIDITAPVNTKTTQLSYTVPSDVNQQKDIVVAATDYITGGVNAQVPLSFKHICTAVRFVVGNDVETGTIKSITLKGIKNSGDYDMTTHNWTLHATTADYIQMLNKDLNGSESSGSDVTSSDGTFMMLPQLLGADAKVEVLFHDGTTGTDRVLSGTIANTEWPIGKTVTYKLSISQGYDLIFNTVPTLQDAHYVMYPITFSAKGLPGGWTLTSTDPCVTLTTALTDLQQQGYWIDEDRGTTSISGTSADNITVYAFLEENISETTRNITLELRPTDKPTATATTFTISQLCPSWNGTFGCERIEDTNTYPWGFKWNRKVRYEFSGFNLFLAWIFDSRFSREGTYYKAEILDLLIYKWVKVEIDYSKLSDLKGANDVDGLINSKYLFNYTGGNAAIDEIEQFCIDYTSLSGGKFKKTFEQGSQYVPSNYAAFEALKLNKFIKEKVEEGGQVMYFPKLIEANMKWYLPSSDQSSLVIDQEYPLQGTYWSSNAGNDNVSAFCYSAPHYSLLTDDRMTEHKVRAVRNRP